ncbi:hypothetical protein BJ165DRAFT_1132791 [Panaeolus papilionaceus]|nr:hypothetical protein BJ165DRAFT_1132791 [Panaeolus papilionaceus]
MYCMKGNDGTDNPNSNAAFQPLYMLPKSEWWFHRVNNCDQFPPDGGDFLELPANGNFTVEHAVNRAFTTTTWQTPMLGVFGDGKDHPDLGISDDGKDGECIVEPNMHTQNETMAAGTAFAISYVSDIEEVTPENLVVFSVLYNTPWKRIATYQVPNLPPCPLNGCICAAFLHIQYGWVPNGCGEPNMYMQGFKCTVTDPSLDLTLPDPLPASISLPRPLAPAQPPVWCEDDTSKCVTGAKQMIFWHQLDGNNVFVDGFDKYRRPKSPGYNSRMGFENGAQTDIFID